MRGGGWMVGCVDTQGQHSGGGLDFILISIFRVNRVAVTSSLF